MSKSPHDGSDSSVGTDQSLATILDTTERRTELTALLAQCILSMRKTITDTFDPRYSGVADSDDRYDDPTKHNEDLSEEEIEKQRDDAEQRIKELSEPRMQELKKAALDFFDKWRDAVLNRVGETLTSKQEAKEQVEKQKEKLPTSQPTGTASLPAPMTIKVDETALDLKDLKDAAGEGEPVARFLDRIYRPIPTLLTNLTEEKRQLLLHALLLLLLSLETYSAHSRILLLHVANSLRLSLDVLESDETRTAKALLKTAQALNADKERESKEKEHASSRKWKIGIAAAAGAAIIGVTGGLAAPMVGAGFATVMGGLGLAETAAAGYLGAVAGSSLLIGGLFGAYGGHMGGKLMDEYAKQVEDFAFVPLHHAKHKSSQEAESKLRVLIGISGWLTDKEDVIKPWRVLSSTIEGYALRFEMEALLKLGNAITTLLKSTAWSYAKKEIIRRTIFAALKEALWPLYILNVGELIDNPFSVAKARSDKAGEVLADALINKVQGERPVTLVGYSLGARVIYTCLLRLAERKAFGLVENVVLAGLPATSDSADWRMMRAVVSGRLINVFSENDYVLAFVYRSTTARVGVAGCQKAAFVRGVESVDASEIVTGHTRYRHVTGVILKRVGFQDIDVEELEREEEELAVEELAEEKEKQEQDSAHAKDGRTGAEDLATLEKEVERKDKQSMIDWAKSRWQTGSEQASTYWQSLVPEKDPSKMSPQEQWSAKVRDELKKAKAS